MKAAEKEVFSSDHQQRPDSILLILPEAILTPMVLFVCTYVARLGGLEIPLKEFTDLLCANINGPVVAFNSNFGHACQPGSEHLLKSRTTKRPPVRGRERKVQGDGTCFNSAGEPIISINPDSDKIYKVKVFSTTGETQVPGVIREDLSDGHEVLVALVAFLNSLPAVDGVMRRQVTIISEQPKMLNYKFRVIRTSPRILVCLRRLTTYMRALESTKLVEGGAPLTEVQAALFAGFAIIPPPYPVRETKPATDDVKVSFRFSGPSRAPRVNIFQEGKVNILGADSVEVSERIYTFLLKLIKANPNTLICLQPLPDHVRRRMAAPSAAAPSAAAPSAAAPSAAAPSAAAPSAAAPSAAAPSAAAPSIEIINRGVSEMHLAGDDPHYLVSHPGDLVEDDPHYLVSHPGDLVENDPHYLVSHPGEYDPSAAPRSGGLPSGACGRPEGV